MVQIKSVQLKHQQPLFLRNGQSIYQYLWSVIVESISQISLKSHTKLQVEEMHLNNHYNRNANLLEFEIDKQLKEYKVR